MDKNDIPVGEQWPEQIVQGIKNANSYLIFISPNSLNSTSVINELTIAYEEKVKRGLQIIPIILTSTEFTDQVRFQLTGIEWIDFSNNFHGNLELLIHTLGVESLPKTYKKHLLSHLPGLYVTPELITPYEKTSKDVVVGKTISIDHIRDQRFMTRNTVLAQVLEEFDLHLYEHASRSDPEILTFWIYGRSGSGKSVLLLQIMQEIILRRNAQVIWLDDAIELIPTLLERWANQQIDIGEPLLVFVDDFNAPQTRSKIDFKTIARLLRNPVFSRVKWPVFVTCSPPEYLNEFQAVGNDEYFRIQKWLIPPISKSEQSDLLEWFKTKTGDVPKPNVAFEQSDGLILSMLFELRHGSMTEFARRFRDRLEGAGLLEQMIHPLALNRIYIWPPKLWLDEFTPQQKDTFVALNLDQDFSIFNTETRSGKYIRLTHPHLSDVIYKAVRPDGTGYQRAEDLALAFNRTTRFDDVLASRILLAIAEGGVRISDDLNEEILAEKIASYWENFVDIVGKSHPIGLAFIWTNLARWASRKQNIKNTFAPLRPLEKAIEILGTEYYLWGDLWLQLWACYPGDKKLIRNAWIWVAQHSHFDESSWYLVWQTLLSHSAILPQGVTITDLLQIGVTWLSGRENRWRWSMIWEKLLQNCQNLPGNISVNSLIQTGTYWLKNHEDRGQWSFVWQALVQHHSIIPLNESFKSLLEYGISWLDGREDQDQWAFVWQDLVKFNKNSDFFSELLNAGIKWLSGRENQGQWAYVWQILLKHPDNLPVTTSIPDLLNYGFNWLIGREDQDPWAFVWQILLKHSDNLPSKTSIIDLLNIGLGWLDGRENLNQWSFVWQILEVQFKSINHPDLFRRLINKGIFWLQNNENRKEWQIVYGICIARIKSDKELRNNPSTQLLLLTGIRWTENHKDEYQAAQLALNLIRLYLDDIPQIYSNRLIDLTRLMVFKSNITRREWPTWWLAYWELRPTIENVNIALKWMEAYGGNNTEGTRSILNRLISTSRPEVIKTITQWQIRNHNNPISEIIKAKLEEKDKKNLI